MRVPLNHPFLGCDFHEINHPAIGDPQMTMEISPDAATPQEFRLQLNRASYRRLFCSGAAGGKPIPGCDGDAREPGTFLGIHHQQIRMVSCDFARKNVILWDLMAIYKDGWVKIRIHDLLAMEGYYSI